MLPSEAVTVVREAVRRRRQAFKGRLQRLERRMHAVTDGPLTFVTRGVPHDEAHHLTEILRPAMEALRQRPDTVARLLAACAWDPNESGCVELFSELIRTLDAGLEFVTYLRAIMPPLEWRAVHRELTRAAAQQARAHVFLALTIGAPDADAASRLRENGAGSFDIGTRHVNRVASLIKLIEQSPGDGPFQADGSLDIAALTWSSVGQQSTSIKGAAKLVHEAFANLPGVPSLSDEYASLLLPMLAMGASVVDPEVLTQRTLQLRAALDAADATSTWTTEPMLLVTRANRGLDRTTSQVERLGREWRYGLPRMHVINSLTEVYRSLVEGALRDLGCIIVIAGRASRAKANGTYERDVVDGVKAGDIITELQRLGAAFGDAVNMLYRNASAHADIEVTDSGIIATERLIEHGREVSRTSVTLSDAEFAEEIIALQEILLALQLTVLPWLWTNADRDVEAAVATAPTTNRQRTQTLTLIAGLAGLREVNVSLDDARVVISAAPYDDEADRREIGILSLIPGAFGAVPTARQVTLHIAGLRAVTFDRAEFTMLDFDEDTPHKLPLLGLVTAKWLLRSGDSWTARDEATYITFPLTQLHFACARLVGSTPQRTENIDRAVDSLRVVRSRLDDVLVAKRRTPQTQRTVKQLDILITNLTLLAESRRGQRSAVEGESAAQQAAATLDSVYQVQEEAKALRDANP